MDCWLAFLQRAQVYLDFMVTSLLSCLCCQKIFADLSAEGIPVIETSTLTEEGVMQVKTEVRCSFRFTLSPGGVQEQSIIIFCMLWFMVLCLSGLRPAPRQSCRDQDEGQEGPRRSQPAPPGHAHQERREGKCSHWLNQKSSNHVLGALLVPILALFNINFLLSVISRRGLRSSQKEPWCARRRWRWTYPNANWYVQC